MLTTKTNITTGSVTQTLNLTQTDRRDLGPHGADEPVSNTGGKGGTAATNAERHNF
jgi:hypothetical protein